MKGINNAEQLAFNVQLNLDTFMGFKTENNPQYMKQQSLQTSNIVENLLNEELQEKNPIELMLNAQMMARGIKQVAAMQILQQIKERAEVNIEDNEARQIIREVMTHNMQDRLETDKLLIEIKEGEPENE